MEPDTPFGSLSEDYSIDLKRYLSLFLSNWYWFAITLLISFSLTYGINHYSEKLYSVSSTLLIKDDLTGGGLSGADAFIPGGEFFKSRQSLRNELGILNSFALNMRVVESLPEFPVLYVEIGRRNIVERKLYRDCPFIVMPEKGVKQTVGLQVFISILSESEYQIAINGEAKVDERMKFGELFEGRGFSFRILLRNPDKFKYKPELSNKYYFLFSSPQGIANQYRRKLLIKPIEEEASIVKLTLTGPVAQQETDYLNRLMELYIIQGLEFKNQTADSTIKFIDSQLNIISDSLAVAERNLEKFRSSNKLIELSQKAGLIQNKLENIETERIKLEQQKQYYVYLREYLFSKNESGDIISPSIMGVTDPQLLRLVPELALLQQQRNTISMNFEKGTEPLLLIEQSIIRTKSSLKESVDEGLITIDNSLVEVKNRLAQVEAEVNKLPVTERQLVTIQRKFDINNTVYTYLLEKRAEAGIAKASSVSDNRIIDRAYLFNSSMVKPQARQNYLFALFFGFLIPILLIFLIDYFNNKIIDKRDIEKGTTVPIIGYISHNDFKSEIPVTEKPGSTLSESFRSVRTNLKYFIKENHTPVIAISSTISAEGKTFISVNLSSIIARLGKRVLLIGLDMRKPRIHKVLEVDNGLGMSTFLCGESSFHDSIQATKIENLFYAPAGPIPPNPAELIENDRMKLFLDQARQEFDYIIIDTPPLAIVTDALILSPLIDMCLMVVRQRYSSKNTLDLIQDLYKNKTLKNIGIIINDISLTGYYGYGLRYGYSMGYGYTYGYNYYGKYVYSRYGYSDSGKHYYSEN